MTLAKEVIRFQTRFLMVIATAVVFSFVPACALLPEKWVVQSYQPTGGSSPQILSAAIGAVLKEKEGFVPIRESDTDRLLVAKKGSKEEITIRITCANYVYVEMKVPRGESDSPTTLRLLSMIEDEFRRQGWSQPRRGPVIYAPL